MKIFYLAISLLVMLPSGALAQQFELRTIENKAWKAGEKTKFRVYYDSFLTGGVTAGEAIIEVNKSNKHFFDRPVHHIIGKGNSKGAFNWFYKVRDRFESYVDTSALIPYLFVRRTQEGKYIKDDDVYFYHDQAKASSRTATKDIPANVQDFVSAVFYLRTLEVEDFMPDSTYTIEFFLDDSVYSSQVRYNGIEKVHIRLGTFRCLRFSPKMIEGEVFSDSYPMSVWVTDDANKLPILAVSEVVVGSVKMELVEYKNLANPISARIED